MGRRRGEPVAIHSGAEAGTIVVRGLDGTQVHLREAGEPSAEGENSEVVVTGVTGDVAIRMGAGADVVHIDDFRHRRSVGIGGGEGEDRILIGTEAPPAPAESDGEPVLRSVNIGGSLRIVTGADGDAVDVRSARVVGRLMISTDGGNDRVRLGLPLEEGARTGESAGTEGSALDPPGGTLHVGGAVAVALGEGDDGLTMRNVGAGSIGIEAGQGDDAIRLGRLGTRVLTVDGGRDDGDDRLTLRGVRADHAHLLLGDGSDRAEIVDSIFTSLALAMGSGNDEAILRGNRARLAVLLGGPGDQDALVSRENRFASKWIRGFEVIPPPDGGA